MVDLTLCRPVKLGKNVVLFFPPTPLDFLDLLRRVIPVVGATIAAGGYRRGKKYESYHDSFSYYFEKISIPIKIRLPDDHIAVANWGLVKLKMLVYLVQDIFKDKIYTAFLSPSSGDVVIDLGAHIGLFTISVAKFAKLVVAIEPHPENYRYLLTNVKLNKIGNVITCRLACSDKEGTGKLYLGHHSGSHSLLFRRSSLRAIDVPLITLSKLVRDLGLNRVDFIKMDIEGAEYSVLVGASQILKSYDVKLAIAAYHDADIRRKCNQLLTELGYKVLEKRGFLYAWKPNGYKTE